MRLFITEINDQKKCGGCNWETTTFYGIAKTKKAAQEIFKDVHSKQERKSYGLRLCSSCICDLLVQENYMISKKE